MKVDNPIPMLRWLVAVVVAGTLGCAPELSFSCEVRDSCGWLGGCAPTRPASIRRITAASLSDALEECRECGLLSCRYDCTCQQE